MKKHLSDIIVALSVIVCSLLLLGALLAATMGNPFADPHLRFTIDFPDVSGIEPAAEVRYAGAMVGSVRSLELLPRAERLLPDNVVRAHIEISEEVELPSDIKVRITTDSMLGQRYISLQRLSDEDGLLAEGAALTAEGAPSMIEDLMPGAEDIIKNADALIADLAGLAARLNGGEDGESITATLANVEAASGNLKELSANLSLAFEGTESEPGLQQRLTASMVNLESITEEVDTLLRGTGDQPGLSGQATEVLENLRAFSGELTVFLRGDGTDPGLEQRLYAISDEVHHLVAGPPGQPEEALRRQLLDVTDRMDALMEEMQVLVVWGQYVTGTLAEKPNRLIFGNKPNEVPTKEQVIEYMRRHNQPFPVRIEENDPTGVEIPYLEETAPAPLESAGENEKKGGLFRFLNKENRR